MENNVFIETHGCSANQNNSEIMAGLLRQAGYNITNNEDIADIIIINSCIVKGKTENKIKRRIQDLARTYQEKLIIIAGCMPQTDAKPIKKLNDKILLLGTHHFKDICKLIKDYKENKLNNEKQESYLSKQDEEKLTLPKIPQNDLISIVQISEGCMGQCNYCKTRLAKGHLYSYDTDKIVNSIESDLENGAKEIWITSQDCANYGLDKFERKLPKLLSKILKLKHRFKLRLGMMDLDNVMPILDELIEIYKNKKMYKFLHIPIQSASDKVLKDMSRKYKMQDAYTIVNRFRKEFPDITFATDLIIGYPSESNEDYEKSLNFIKTYKPQVFNLSKISIHKGTILYELVKNKKLVPISIKTINKRTREIMQEHRKTAQEHKKKFLNSIIEVFVNKKLPGFYEARDENYNIVLIKSSDKKIFGKNINVKIVQIGVHHMIGELIQQN